MKNSIPRSAAKAKSSDWFADRHIGYGDTIVLNASPETAEFWVAAHLNAHVEFGFVRLSDKPRRNANLIRNACNTARQRRAFTLQKGAGFVLFLVGEVSSAVLTAATTEALKQLRFEDQPLRFSSSPIVSDASEWGPSSNDGTYDAAAGSRR